MTRLSSLDAIRNFVRISPDIGTGGQPGADQFHLIAAAGYRAVVNLAMPDHADSIDDEGKRVTDLGMCYYHLPVPFDAPTAAHAGLFCRLLDAQRDWPVFVHCIMNYRVSAFIYLYLTQVKKIDPAAARSPIFERWSPDEKWQAILQLDAAALGLRPS